MDNMLVEEALKQWRQEGWLNAQVFHNLLVRMPPGTRTVADLRRIFDSGELEAIGFIGKKTIASLRAIFDRV